MSYVKWSCKFCTYENYPASLKCVICQQPKNPPVIEPPPLITEDTLPLTSNNDIICSSESNLASDAAKSLHGDLIISSLNDTNERTKLFESLSDSSNCVTRNKKNIETSEHGVKNKHAKCNACTFVNEITKTRKNCEVCGHLLNLSEVTGATASNKEPSESNEPSKDNEINNKNELLMKWNCSNCTYSNWRQALKCVMCAYPQSTQSGSQTVTSDIDSLIPTSSKIVQLNKDNQNKAVDTIPTDSDDSEINKNDNNNDMKLSTSISVPNVSTIRSRTSSGSSNSSVTLSKDDNSLSNKHSRRNNRNSVEKLNFSKNSKAGTSNTSRIGAACAGSNMQRSNSKSRVSSVLRKEAYLLDNCDVEKSRHIKNKVKNLNLLFLKACIGILENNIEAVERYLSHGGSVARALTADEVRILNRPSAFDVGHTLVHLAIRFRRHQIMGLILQPELTNRVLKRCPSLICPDLADLIAHDIYASLRCRKGEFHCRYFCENVTFQLPFEITDLPSSFREMLFDELLDHDAQKELEDDLAINWCSQLVNGGRGNRLHALWNRSAGDCLLDSVLQATWGIFDKENILRRAMSETLHDCAPYFYKRWKDWEIMQARLLGYSLTERQCIQDWAFLLSLAQQPGASLEHCHIFVLAHILRRPIIVYSVKYLKSYHGDTLGYTKFQGVYLPFFWDQNFCWKSPIALGFTRGHFSALVTMENEDCYGGGANFHRNNQQASPAYTYLPLVDSNHKILPVHFTSADEAVTEAERECLLYEWLDCSMTNTGILVAKQKTGKRPTLVTRMLDQWLDHYRHLSIRRLGEVGDSEEE